MYALPLWTDIYRFFVQLEKVPESTHTKEPEIICFLNNHIKGDIKHK